MVELKAVAWRYQRKEGWGDIWRVVTILPTDFETPDDWTVQPLGVLAAAQGAMRPKTWQCLAVSKAACAWPDCGCDPEATKVIAAVVEQGWEAPNSSDGSCSVPTATIAATQTVCDEGESAGDIQSRDATARRMSETVGSLALRQSPQREDGASPGPSDFLSMAAQHLGHLSGIAHGASKLTEGDRGCGTPGCTDPNCTYGSGTARCQRCGHPLPAPEGDRWPEIDRELSAYVQTIRAQLIEECAVEATRCDTHELFCMADPAAIRRDIAMRIRALALPSTVLGGAAK